MTPKAIATRLRARHGPEAMEIAKRRASIHRKRIITAEGTNEVSHAFARAMLWTEVASQIAKVPPSSRTTT